jgi:pyruvate-formate lyase
VKRVAVRAPKGTTIAEDKDEAGTFRDDVILPALAEGERVEIDFTKVEAATQSYIHVLVADAVRRYGDDIFGMIQFKGAAPGIKSLIATVFEYTMLAKATADGTESVGPEAEGSSPARP